ncbi:hypothetical protein HUG10_00905 [Halorarum halophilum]|uniref:Uncharacterized protein n=1 Tax=Halorarum halophilum TaxID=2743090 RepID=A0A7D5L2J3_9EURY|nr:hypothetical protein [Halobaculum halophilum]QLG26183.1 hypothetical protein HUG10_00905 [Halobaculum halophilum]
MAKVVYEGPSGIEEAEVDADKISDSGKVRGVRIKLDDGSYLHVPYTRLYSIEMSEEEGQVDYSSR